jgi:outer membrane protein assembly factor BamB
LSLIILPNNLMVVGRNDGRVSAYNVESGDRVWEYDAGQTVFATPATPLGGRMIFVVSKNQVHVLDTADGTLIHDAGAPRKLTPTGQTYASPAITANKVYVAVGIPEAEMLTLSYTLEPLSK